MSASFGRFAFSFLALCVFAGPAAAEEPLRWKLAKGEKFTLQVQQKTDSLVTLSSRKLASTVDLLLLVGWEVQQAEADSFTVEQTVDAIRLEMKGPGENNVIYDSREKKALVGAAKELQASLTPLLGAKFTFTMNSQGTITSANQVVSDLGDKIPGMSADSVRQLLQQSQLPLPRTLEGKEPTWTDERETAAAIGQVKQKRTFTLAGNEDRDGVVAAKITVAGTLEVVPVAGKKGAAKLTNQSHSGTTWFDHKAGRMLAAETTQRLVTESAYRDSAIVVDLTTVLVSKLTPR